VFFGQGRCSRIMLAKVLIILALTVNGAAPALNRR
jgi:hypothetical protein